MVLFQERAGDIFTDKNTKCLEASAEKRRSLFYELVEGADEGGKPVNGEHPDGSLPF